MAAIVRRCAAAEKQNYQCYMFGKTESIDERISPAITIGANMAGGRQRKMCREN